MAGYRPLVGPEDPYYRAPDAPVPTFSAGAVVKLKSGGEHMTVLDVRSSDSAVAVVWMTPAGELRRETLNQVLLVPSNVILAN